MIDLFPLMRPLLHALPPEAAHACALLALRLGLGPSSRAVDDPILETAVFGRHFANPLGMAAGFDKNAAAIGGAFRLGFGFIEVGGVTPQPQSGNPRPRLFRLPEDAALINRMGLNSAGLDVVTARLGRQRPFAGPLAVNLGCNRASADPAADYHAGVAACADPADMLVINVSSPNTAGLRALQRRAALSALVDGCLAAREATGHRPALLIKIAPDLTDEERDDIAEVAVASGIDGLVVANTTTARPPSLASRHACETGGLSGRPLMAASTRLLRDMAQRTGLRLPIVGVGGVASGADAYAKIRAGASLVQLYTALIYGGPRLVGEIKNELAALLRADGYATVGDAVGVDIRNDARRTPNGGLPSNTVNTFQIP